MSSSDRSAAIRAHFDAVAVIWAAFFARRFGVRSRDALLAPHREALRRLG